MAFDLTRYRELTPQAGRQYSGGCAQRDGSLTVPYLIEPPGSPPADTASITPDDIRQAILTAVGQTTGAITDGRISRTLPLSHPLMANWTVGAVNRLQGEGEYTLTAPDEIVNLDLAQMPQWAHFKRASFELEYKPRPYALVADSNIPVRDNGSYYDSAVGTSATKFSYAEEWRRFFRIKVAAMDSDRVTAEQGLYQFNTDYVSPTFGAINNTGFTGHPQMPLQLVTLFIHWYEVPYRYITSPNSYLTRWRGRINQNPWLGYGAGSLLYDGFTADDYCSPFPNNGFKGAFFDLGPQFLCDIVLKFIYTARTISGTPPSPSNHNYIVGGHNLLPYFPDRVFLYGQSKAAVPSWLSFPLELLFTDPDTNRNPLPITVS